MKRIVVILTVVVVAGAALAWALSAPRPRYSAEEWQKLGLAGDAAAGRLVFYAGGCKSCHKSPGQDDPLKLGGGLELKTPFGSFYPPNISTDPVDGIGALARPSTSPMRSCRASPRTAGTFTRLSHTLRISG